MVNEAVKLEIDTSNYKILIVDDVMSNIMLLKALLKGDNYQVVTACDGTEALAKVAREHPDLILLDVMMPGMSGFDVSATLHQSKDFNDIPIIFLTALNSHEDIVKGFELGANDFITKPFNKDELKIRIRHQISLIEAKRIIIRQTEELRKSIEGRAKLYSVIANDFRTPLGSIKSSLNRVLSSVDDKTIGSDMLDTLKEARQTAEDAFSLLDNLLKWSKSRLNNLVVTPCRCDIGELILDAKELFMRAAENKNIDVVLRGNTSAMVLSDVDMTKTVLGNLISNAIKFSHRGDTVSIAVDDSDDDFVTVSVKDSGCGIKAEDRDKLLVIETHFSTAGTDNEEGSGLGLLLCVDFARKNGGELWFDSVFGEGSTFYFTLPKR